MPYRLTHVLLTLEISLIEPSDTVVSLTMDRSNGSTANAAVQTVRDTAEVTGIRDHLIRQLVKNRNIGKYQIEHISLGNTGLDRNNAVVLSWQDQTRPGDIKTLQEKISSKPNTSLDYSSPIEILDSRTEQLSSSKDGLLFYIAVKFRKEQNRNVGEEENDTDSGMGDSGHGDSPDTEESVEQENQEKGGKEERRRKRFNERIRKKQFAERKDKKDLLKINETTKNENKPRNNKNKATNDKNKTTNDENGIPTELSGTRRPLLSREELRRRYTRIKRHQNTREKKSAEEQKMKLDRPMWLAANLNSFNTHFKERPCYSFHCLPRIRNK